MKKALHLPHGAGDWELLTSVAGAEEAAQTLTESLRGKLLEARRLIAAGATALPIARKVRDEMYLVMDGYTAFGARGVEPETTLVDVIEHGLGLEAWTLPRKD